MDEAERKRLKNQGKELVQKRSQEVRDALARANPAPITDPQWAKNYKTQNQKEREFRSNPPDYISARDAQLNWELLTVDDSFRFGFPVALWHYYECSSCRDLIHALPVKSIACSCGAIRLDVDEVELSAAPEHPLRLVKLIAKASQPSFFDRIFKHLSK
jgi:hypothetical protein